MQQTVAAPKVNAQARTEQRGLDVFFSPRSVAVIGATENPGHVGRAVLWNLISSPFGGTVHPINPERNAVLGIRSYPSILAVPEEVDLAVVTTPAETVPGVIQECARAGVQGAVIVSAGFRETGSRGAELERQILTYAREAGMRVIGPNCLGVMCPVTGLNASFAETIARPGTVALISQSGAICSAILDWSLRAQVGFSAFLSVGSMLDVGWGSLIDYLGNDPNTRSIVIYMETVGDARSFLSAAREVALDKPILVVKAGATESAAKAVVSHTGSTTGSDAVLDAAFRRVGVLRVNELDDVFYMTEVLARQPRPAGPRLAIITNAGGPGILATDTHIKLGGELARLTPESIDALNRILPPHWSHGNPIDVIGDAGPERYECAVKIAAEDPNVDGLLVIMTPQAEVSPTAIAEKLTACAKLWKKPILASWMGGFKVVDGAALLNRAGIPTTAFPDTAVRAFSYMWRYSYNLRGLYETPSVAGRHSSSADTASQLIDSVRNNERTLLTEWESRQLLEAYGIPTLRTRFTATEGYELRLSSSIDPQFGPVLRFGMGGHLAEVFRDWALALPPLNTTLARRLMEQTRIFEALKGVRGRRAIDIEALERLLVRFSELVLEQSAIREIDINPLLASPAGLLVLDAQVVLYHKETPTSDIPRPAIRPYPSQYCGRVSLADGTVLNIRPIRPEDEPEVVRFHSTLSQESVFSRYFALIRLEKRIRHERLIRMCFVDYDRQMAMVAQKVNPDGLLDGIVAIARLRKSPLRNEAEVAVVVSDAFHRRGIGTLLIHRLIEIARDERIAVLTASVLADNPSMRTLLEKEGFVFDDSNFSEIVHGAVQL